jgi:type I site-specific restriction-modification system R (restriction) subunit
MSPEVSERSFEETIECGLLQRGPDACARDGAIHERPSFYGNAFAGGYRKRAPEDYDRTLCLIPRDVTDFILATQPKEWEKLTQHHGAAVREQFLNRLAVEIERRGALDVLRNGIKDSGCKFKLAFFRPASGLNEETQRLYQANIFAVIRQLRYSEKNENCFALALFLNGIPIFTTEIKNPFTGQDIEDAIRQYKTDRDPREPLLAYGRCLAHFAVDPDLVYVTTHLVGSKTRFLPFNRGKFGGAGNPPVPPTHRGYATGYLWEETWARDSVLDLVRQFVHEVEEEDERGRKTGKRFLIFPRYQQLDAVRKLVAHAREAGTGQRYLIQHSAGSGKSFTIAWLAHQLSTPAFEPYYETTLLSEETDPNLLYEFQTQLGAFPVFTETDVNNFARLYFDPKATQDQLYAALSHLVERFKEMSQEERHEFRGQLADYVRLYAFLAQVLTFADAGLEKLYVFARHLRRLLPADRFELPRDVQQNIDMESYRIQQTRSDRITLERKGGALDPQRTKSGYGLQPEEIEPLSRIIVELNERFGLNLGPEHRVTLEQMMEKLDGDAALDAAAQVNTRENVRLAFDHKVESVIQEIVDSNFDLYKRITDDRGFGEALKNFLFDQYVQSHRNAAELIMRGESKTLEFKSTLRWNLKEDRKDDKAITHAVLKTIAAFLNTDGGDLLIGVSDDGSVVGIERDQLENNDKFMLHLSQVVRNGLGDRASTCIDPKTQVVQDKTVCIVSCQRSPEPVFLKWKGLEKSAEGDFFVRSGPGTVPLSPDSTKEYIRTRFPAKQSWTEP